MKLSKLQIGAFTLILVITMGSVHSVAAAGWGDCTTEQGTTTIADGSPTTFLTPTHTIDDDHINGTFVLAQATGDLTVRQSYNHLVTAEISGTRQILFQRQGTTGTVQVSYTIIQCSGTDKIKKVHGGSIVVPGGASSATGSLAIPVDDLNHSLVLVTTRSDNTVANDSDSIATASLSDTSHVVVQRATAAASTMFAYYQVIEFPTSSDVTVQQPAEVTLSPGQATTTVTLDTPVASDRTWVYCSYDASNNGLQQTSIGCYLSDSSTVTVARAAASAYTNRVRVYTVTWPVDTVTVLSGTEVDDAIHGDNSQYDNDITIPAPGAHPNHSFSYVTLTTNSTSTAYPRNQWLNYIYQTGTLRASFWRGDPSGNAANTKYWQVINFPRPYEATGWGYIINSADGVDPVGLISFNCDNLSGYITTTSCKNSISATTRYDYGVELEHGGCGTDCDVTGQAWIGTYNAGESGSTIGMIDFDPVFGSGVNVPPNVIGDDPSTAENEQQDAHWNEETGELYGWARFHALENYEDDLGGTADDWGWINLRGPVSGVGEYGVRFDPSDLSLSGWGWNDNGSDPSSGSEEEGSGLGWLKFDLDTFGTVGDAWLRTNQGDVYSQNGFDMSTAAPSGEYNATYLILTDGDVNQFSTEPLLGTTITNHDLGGVPTDNTSQVFRGNLGSIYVNELIDQATADGHATSGDCTAALLTGVTTLGGNVYYCSGDLTINTNLTFYNGTNQVGSGTIVVGGNLHLNNDLYYNNDDISGNINHLASLAFIVQGHVEVGPLVRHLVGAYAVLGDADPDETGVYDFATGDSTLPLELEGLVMARSFNFQRKSLGQYQDQPAEDFSYDGRVLANPPPGLEDFTSVLPEYE